MSVETSSQLGLSKKKVISTSHTSVYDQTLTMMFSSQTLLSQQMEELKDSTSVLTCYRCNRTIKAVDSLNDQMHDNAVKSRGTNAARQVDLFHMVNKMQHKNRKMSDTDMNTPAKTLTSE